jgi:hypothetical protein
MDTIDDATLKQLDDWVPDQTDVKALSKIAQNMLNAQQVVKNIEVELKEAKEKFRQLQEYDLPAAMGQAGVEKLTLPNGPEIKVETFYSASISEENKEQAFNWLDETGNGDIIKNVVGVDFKRGQDELARGAEKVLKDAGYDPHVSASVHPSTLRAFVREEVEAGRELSPAITLYVGTRAKVS